MTSYRVYSDTFWTNPQYRIDIVDPDEEDDDNAGTLIVGLLQEEVRKKGTELLTVGYAIYRVIVCVCVCLFMCAYAFSDLRGELTR